MLLNLLDFALIAVPIVGLLNRRKLWGRRLAYASTVILVVVYASVPALRHHVVDGFLEGYNWDASK